MDRTRLKNSRIEPLNRKRAMAKEHGQNSGPSPFACIIPARRGRTRPSSIWKFMNYLARVILPIPAKRRPNAQIGAPCDHDMLNGLPLSPYPLPTPSSRGEGEDQLFLSLKIKPQIWLAC